MERVGKIEDSDGQGLWQFSVVPLVATHIFLNICRTDCCPALP